MTIKIENLEIDFDASSHIRPRGRGWVDVTRDETHRLDMLAVVRHIMRSEKCDMVPTVRRAIVCPTNEYGHNFLVEVTYSTRGWRAVYAAHIAAEVTSVCCYMN